MISDSVAPPVVGLQSIHQPVNNLVIRIDLHSHDTLCTDIAAGFMNHASHKHLARFAARTFPSTEQIQQDAGCSVDGRLGDTIEQLKFLFQGVDLLSTADQKEIRN
jgi:hypothetical protein